MGSAKARASDAMHSQYKLKCPKCGHGSLIFVEGCVKCQDPGCDYSKC